MKPVKIFSLAFMNSHLISESFDRLYRTRNKEMPIEHHVLYQHYPVNKEENRILLLEAQQKFGFILHDAGKNLGLHEGYNYLFKKINPAPEEVIICYDPDSTPVGYGWDLALVSAIEGSNGEIVWASLMNPRSEIDLKEKGYDPGLINGFLKVWKAKRPVVNSICAFKYDWLQKDGFWEPRPFYGHFETAMFNKLGSKRWAFLTGWGESDDLRDMHDREYTEYKWAHAHELSFDGDFEAWLKAGKPLKDRAPKKIP